MPDAMDREALIDQISGIQHDIGRALATGGSLPLLDTNLTMQQLKVVLVLSLEGPTSGQTLARQLGVGLGTTTGIVDRLVAQDLVTRYEDPQDRRIRRTILTETGHDLANKIINAGMSHFRLILNKLDTQTLSDVASVMTKLRDVVLSGETET